MAASSHTAHLLIGSNIEPVVNVRQAILELCHFGILRHVSRAWQTPAHGSDGPDFINLAVELITPRPLESVKSEVVAVIEKKLGRQRSADKNAPRTIDLDIILFDGELLDAALWDHVHLAVTLGELLPDLVNPATGESLAALASRLAREKPVIERPDVLPKMK
jgi:2-amino-4-hydroxy-6-hydroxymethyldihydropteridine diphosphokinase